MDFIIFLLCSAILLGGSFIGMKITASINVKYTLLRLVVMLVGVTVMASLVIAILILYDSYLQTHPI